MNLIDRAKKLEKFVEMILDELLELKTLLYKYIFKIL